MNAPRRAVGRSLITRPESLFGAMYETLITGTQGGNTEPLHRPRVYILP